METDTSSLHHRTPAQTGFAWCRAWMAVMLVFALSYGQALAQSFPATLSNTATVTLPANVSDPAPGNNAATDTNALTASAKTTNNLLLTGNLRFWSGPTHVSEV